MRTHYEGPWPRLAKCGQRHAFLRLSGFLSNVDCLDCLRRAEREERLNIQLAEDRLATIEEQRAKRVEEDA